MPVETSALAYYLFIIQLEASSNNVCSTRFTCQGNNNVDKRPARYSGRCLSCENLTVKPLERIFC